MSKARQQANLSSDGNLFADISNDRVGIGSVVPTHKLHVNGTSKFDDDVKFEGTAAANNIIWDKSADRLNFSDLVKASFGAGGDLTIYHNGSNSYLDNGTGDLYLRPQSDIYWQNLTSGDVYLKGINNGAVEIYYDGNKKFETLNTGAKVTGNLEVTGVLTYDDVTSIDSVGIITAREGVQITADNKYLKIGAGNDISIVHTGSESFISNSTGHLTRRSDVHKWENYAGSSEYVRIDSSGRLLIGTTTEGYSSGDDLTIATSGHTGITIRSGTTSEGAVYFSDATSGAAEYIGSLVYSHNTNAMVFTTNGTERLRIDSTGILKLYGDGSNNSVIYGHRAGSLTYILGNQSGSNDLNIKTWASSTNIIFSIAGNNEKVRIDSNGDLNLGNNPTNQYGYKLNIQDDAILYAQTASSNGTELKLYLDHSNTIANFGTVTTSHLAFVTSNTEKVRIESGGGLKFTGQGTSIPVGGILHHTNNNLYVRGGTSGLVLGNQDNTNTIHISDSNFIKFETTDGSERLRIDSSGNICGASGIINLKNPSGSGDVFVNMLGTSGDARLDLESTGNGNYSGIDFVRERASGTGVVGGAIFMKSDTSNNLAHLYIQAQSASAQSPVTSALAANNGVRLLLEGGSGKFGISTGDTERFLLTASGGCHIGLPATTNSWDTHAISLTTNSTTFACPATLTIFGGTGFGTANMAGGGIRFVGYYDANNFTTFAHVAGVKENTTSGNYAGALTFHTRANGGLGAERLRIDSNGNIRFGVHTGSSAGINNAHIKWLNCGSDYWSGTAGDYRAIRFGTYYMGIDDIYGVGISNSLLEIQSQADIGWFAGTVGSGTGRRKLRMKLEGANGRLQIQNGGRIEILNDSNSGYDGALLKIGYNTGETRAIDIGGNWSANESKSITFNHGSSATQMVGQINCLYNGTGSHLRWGKLYHSGDSSTYTMELQSSSTTTATLKVTDQIIVGDPSDTQDYSYATAIFRHKSPRSATGGNTGWPYWLPTDNNRTQHALVQITAGGNGGTSTAGHGPIATVVLGEYYDSAGLITVKGGGSASPSDQGTGNGKDLMIAAGNSDNTSGRHGGRLMLQSGSGYQGSAFHNNHGETWINQFGGDVHIGGCSNQEQKLVQYAYPNLASSTATVVDEQSGSQWEAKYVTQQGMSNSNDQAWYKYEFHGGYASRAHNLDLWVTWTTGHAAPSGCGRWHIGVWEPHGGHFGINCKRQYFMDFNSGGTYYSWGVNPSVYLYRATTPNASGTHTDQNYNRLYFAVRGRIGSNPNYGGALRHLISCTVHENNYRGNPAQPGSGVTRVRNKFEYVGETNPSDLGTYYAWDNLP